MKIENKLLPTEEAVKKFVDDGALVCFGGFTHGIPFALGHEMIRQKKRNLKICKETPDLLVDQMIAAGCVKHTIFSWAGNPGVGLLHAFRRAIEKSIPKPITYEEYTHFIMAARYFAGASRIPFIPISAGIAGSDLIKYRKNLKTMDCPYTGKKLCLVPAMNPDIAIIHAQRADREGNVQMWGIFGSNKEIAMASQKVIVSVEEIVDEETVRRDPNRTIIPGFHVDAIMEEPWGAHPSYTQGYYDRDNDFYIEYDQATRTVEGMETFLNEWVYGLENRKEYVKKLGAEKILKLMVKPYYSFPVNYGYYG